MFLNKFNTFIRAFDVKFSTAAKTVIAQPNEECLLPKILKVSIIGIPNAGKSTVINNLMDRKVCPASRKVHTTRAKSQAIFSHENVQIIFLDTPGLVNIKEQKRYNLEKSFLKDCKSSLSESDLIGVVHDVSNHWTRDRLDIKVISLLEKHMDKPSILIFNKVDLIKTKRKLLDLTRSLTNSCIDGKPIPGSKFLKKEDNQMKAWSHFQDVFMVSALTGCGLDDLKNYFIKRAKPGEWQYPADVWSDQTAEDIIRSSVKAKLLDFLPQELPYKVTPAIEFFDRNDDGVITTVVIVHCPSERHAKLIAGDNDGKLRQITESLQRDLQYTFQNFVRLKIVMDSPKEK